MTAAVTVDFVIAVHDLSRPIRRAVASVLDSTDSSNIGVIVVAHGIDTQLVRTGLATYSGPRLRVVPFSDGIASPAGPFNHGISLSTADYVAVMGSDDYLEAGAVEAWLSYVDVNEPAALIAPLRHQSGQRIPSPLTRRNRSCSLDAVHDRLFYRSAPLGLLRSTVLRKLGLQFTEGFASGEDLRMSVALWSSQRVDYCPALPAYVIGADALTRVTTAPASAKTALAPILDLINSTVVSGLNRGVRRALAIKLLRIHVLGALLSRKGAEHWDREQRESVRTVIDLLLRIAPHALAPLSTADRMLIHVGRTTDTAEEWAKGIAQRHSAHRLAVVLPRNPFRIFDRESDVVRLVRYRLDR